MKKLIFTLLFLSAVAVANTGKDSIGKECFDPKDALKGNSAVCKGGVCFNMNLRSDMLCDMMVCSVACKTKTDCPTTAHGSAKCITNDGQKVCSYSGWDKKYCGGD